MIPIVGTLLSNGLNLLANACMAKGKEFIKNKTGVDLEKSSLTDKDLLELKKYEMEHEEELLKIKLEENKLDMEEMKAYMADTADARSREVKINESANAHVLAKIASPVLAFATILLTFGLFYFLLFLPAAANLENTKKDVVLYILGVLSAISSQIFSYYFGSSKGSSEKTTQ